MIPFPGESVGIDVALIVEGVGVYDESLYDSIRRRGSIGSAPATRALSSDEWRAWVYPGSQTYLEDDATDVVVSWVVEVASGSGTITASMGFDPMFGDPEAAHPTSLGAHPVTGPTTLVLPTGLTAADVMSGDDSMMLVLTSTGTLDVAQVKLRAWPSAGVAGGWSATQPAFNTTPTSAPIRYGAESILGTSSNTDPEAAWDDAYADFTANLATESAPAPRTVTTTPSLTTTASQGSEVVDVFTGEISSAHNLILCLVILLGADWRTFFPIAGGLVEGVDWIRPPAEVADDTAYIVERDGDGSTGWLNAVVTTTTLAGGDFDMPGDGIAASEAGTFTPVSGVVTVGLNHVGSAGVVPLDTSGQDIAVTITHDLATGAGEAWPGPPWDAPGVLGINREDLVSYVLGVDGVPVQTFATLPPYRVWVPTLVEAIVSKVRQFHRDDGLGVTPPRAFGGASRIRTGRAYGYD